MTRTEIICEIARLHHLLDVLESVNVRMGNYGALLPERQATRVQIGVMTDALAECDSVVLS